MSNSYPLIGVSIRSIFLCLIIVSMTACQTGQSPSDGAALDESDLTEEERVAAELEAQRAREAELLQQQIEAARREAELKELNERYQQALDELKAKNYAVASSVLSDLEPQVDELPLLTTNLGLALLAQQEWSAAEATFQRALKRSPKDTVALNHLGVAQRQQGKFSAALTSYQEALTIDPDYAAAHLNVAILFDIYLQDLPKAMQHYQAYLELQEKEDKLVMGWLTDLKRRLDKQ